MRSVLSATAYCHANGFIVRNLTADNIMVKKVGECVYETKIADFSQAVVAGSDKCISDHTIFEWADVPYMAPEALLGQSYSTAMDVWSIGVLLFTMLSGELPFDDADDQKLIEKIKFASYQFAQWNAAWQPSVSSDKAKYLIGQILVAGADDRLTCKDVMRNEWIVMG
eukprot:gene34599-42678_t